MIQVLLWDWVQLKFNVMILKGVGERGLYIVGKGLEMKQFIDRYPYDTNTSIEAYTF